MNSKSKSKLGSAAFIEMEALILQSLKLKSNGALMHKDSGRLLRAWYQSFELSRLGSEIREDFIYNAIKRRKSLGIEDELISVPAGVYTRNEELEVYVSEYRMSSTPVTNKMFNYFMPKEYKQGEDDMPVTNVSWYDAMAFCLWSGLRLPTEAEWEYSCCTDGDQQWAFELKEFNKYGWSNENAYGKLQSVGKLKANDFGLHDLHGNTWEWCIDTYEERKTQLASIQNPCNFNTGDLKVCKGGSFLLSSDMTGRDSRYRDMAEYRTHDLGFRVVSSRANEIWMLT